MIKPREFWIREGDDGNIRGIVADSPDSCKMKDLIHVREVIEDDPKEVTQNMNFIKIPDRDYEIMDAPVTQAEWFEVMGSNPSYFKGTDHPVERVSWNDCQTFITKLNTIKDDGYTYRLPTETEWEYCAKSCDKQNIDEIAWHWENSNEETHPVKQKIPNKLELYDMLGNVWEWCSNKHIKNNFNRVVVRGGSWFSYAQYLRSACRSSGSPGFRGGGLGFRLVREIKNDR